MSSLSELIETFFFPIIDVSKTRWSCLSVQLNWTPSNWKSASCFEPWNSTEKSKGRKSTTFLLIQKLNWMVGILDQVARTWRTSHLIMLSTSRRSTDCCFIESKKSTTHGCDRSSWSLCQDLSSVQRKTILRNA